MRTIKSIYFFYSKPFFNKYYTHNRGKALIWALLVGLALPIAFTSQFGNLFSHATLATKIWVIVVESLLLSALRVMNEGMEQMYADRKLVLFHSAGIPSSQIIFGQWLSRFWFYVWSSVVIMIPLTAGLPWQDKLTSGVLLFGASLLVEVVFDLFSRYLLILCMYYIPQVTKYFFGFSTLGFLAVFGLLVWAVLGMDTISAEAWRRFEQLATYTGAAVFAVFAVLLLMNRHMNRLYYQSWLKFTENERSSATQNSSRLSELIRGPKDAILVKDLMLLQKNLMTKIRAGLWLAGIIAAVVLVKFNVLDAYVTTEIQPFAIFAFALVWTMLIFGEIISTLYQQEGQNYVLYYAAAIKGREVFSAKLNLAIMLAVIPSAVGYAAAALMLQIEGGILLLHLSWIIYVSCIAVIVQLGIAALDRKSRQGKNLSETSKDQSVVMEQMPRSLLPILSNLAGLVVAAFSLLLLWFDVHYALILLLLLLPAVLLYAVGVRASGSGGR